MAQSSELSEIIADVKEQIVFLQELGVTDMNVDLSVSETGTSVGQEILASAVLKPRPGDVASEISNLKLPAQAISPARAPRAAGSRLKKLPSLKDLAPVVPGVTRTEIEIVPDHADVIETIPEIRAEIGPACTRCKLGQLGRKQVVNSVGNFEAELMFVGEAPGADEDQQGEPFVGRAGQLLTKIIEGIGLKREDVFIGNINRCRPPKNRAPEPDESVVCKPFLLREIAVVRPKVIVVLGATAAQNLLETNTPIGKLRGRFHEFRGTKVMPTFHPAYLLRDPNKKREVWDDMKLVRSLLREK